MEIQLWREILDPYGQAVSEITTKLNNFRLECKNHNIYCPMESIQGRVKEVSGIIDKMRRKGIPFERMEEEIEDIAGIRIICQFIEDIEAAVEVIEKRTDMEILHRKDYLTNQKKSGYRSYHLIIAYTVNTMKGPKRLQAEIQVRTMALNFWATSEHFLQYKYKNQLPEQISAQLERIAQATTQLDEEMMKVRNEIMDAENNNSIQCLLVKDILNTIENLYRLSNNEREAIKIQDEFYRIYRLNDLNALQHFHDQLDILSEDNQTQSIN